MTEKRYFSIDYDEEYYIFDSTKISKEEVLEKAEYSYDVFGDSLMENEVLDLLNENEQSKQSIDRLIDKYRNAMTDEPSTDNWYCNNIIGELEKLKELGELKQQGELEKKNEQLKKQIQRLERERRATQKQHEKWDKQATERIRELEKEILDLRAEVGRLKNKKEVETPHWLKYKPSKGYTKKVNQDIRFDGDVE